MSEEAAASPPGDSALGVDASHRTNSETPLLVFSPSEDTSRRNQLNVT